MRKLIQSLLVAFSMFFAGAAFAQETGYIHALSGGATITRVGKPAAPAKVGDLFEQGTSIVTAADGKVTLKFADGQVIALAPNTSFTVTTYDYNTANVANSNIVFNLARGGLRFVTGLIGQKAPSKFAVRTPTMTAGVRGTDATIAIGNNGSTLVTVLQGMVSITNATGTVNIDQNSFAYYPPGAARPIVVGSFSQLPPEAQALVLMVQELSGRTLPPPTPVNVIDAAKEAVDAAVQSGAGNVVPASTPGPGGGGGGGTGISPN